MTQAKLTFDIPKDEFHELRLDVLRHADDNYQELILTRAMDELRADVEAEDDTYVYSLTPTNTWVESTEDGLSFKTTQPTDDVLDNEEMLKRVPLAVINSDFWDSDTYSETRLLAQILYDSGVQLGEIESILGTELFDEAELTI